MTRRRVAGILAVTSPATRMLQVMREKEIRGEMEKDGVNHGCKPTSPTTPNLANLELYLPWGEEGWKRPKRDWQAGRQADRPTGRQAGRLTQTDTVTNSPLGGSTSDLPDWRKLTHPARIFVTSLISFRDAVHVY
ncbi:hypothetical protein E2C01_087711 [Portunus trituberculatus]|uniref:Uncharacterized protein n=1 Tax=Portunus trituberculatus TaxID=210409 RepID=A0A5B7J8W7_PORTR|nr:hypothetical protein [Portunus trituberculatus]